jgi:hypothetical protein
MMTFIQANQKLIARTETNTACLNAVRGSASEWLATKGRNKKQGDIESTQSKTISCLFLLYAKASLPFSMKSLRPSYKTS